MPRTPLLPAAQWLLIEPLLASNRHDKRMVSAVLFRQTSAVGLRDVCELFDVTRTRLSEWERALEADGSLAKIMRELQLERAGSLSWRRGGVASWRRHNQGRSVMQFRLERFASALERLPRGKASG